MVAQITPVSFRYSHTIGRQETRGGDGFFHPVAVKRGPGELLYVLSRGTETPVFFPCKRVTVCTVDEEYIDQFGFKVHPEDAVRSAADGALFWPTSIALDSLGNAYVADEWLNRISVFDKDGEFIQKWGDPGSSEGKIDRPSGMEFDAEDNLYIVDSRNHRIQVFAKDGKFLSTWGTQGSEDGQLNFPWGIDIDQNGDVYVADWRNDRIQKFTADGRFLMKFGSAGSDNGQFNRPTGVAVDKDGTIYVADFKNDRVQIFDADGDFITSLSGEATVSKWGQERVNIDPTYVRGREIAQNLEEREKAFQGPIAVDVDDEGRLFVSEVPRHRVQVFHKRYANFEGGAL
jgi:DNA-binding beta-propeller fold protein YncE